MARIGILTSINFDGAANSLGRQFKDSFETGYRRVATGGAGPTYANGSPHEANAKYSADGRVHKKLNNGVNKFNGNNADLIVALGGLVSAYAAVQFAEKPFLVLVGRRPDPTDFALEDSELFFGGNDLQAPHDKAGRVPARGGIGGAEANIWLMYNPNSKMGRAEAADWKRTGKKSVRAAVSADEDPEGNDPAEFETAFRRLVRRGARGVVVSSDPSFSKHRNDLVTQANAFFASNQIKVCYPSEIYGSANPPPSANSSVTVGPRLLTAYELVGEKAARIANSIDGGQAPTFQGLDSAALIAPFFFDRRSAS